MERIDCRGDDVQSYPYKNIKSVGNVNDCPSGFVVDIGKIGDEVSTQSTMQSTVQVKFHDEHLWRQPEQIMEMIANKEGTPISPGIAFLVNGLDEDGKYEVKLSMERVDFERYTYTEWQISTKRKAAPMYLNREVSHKDGVKTGKEWMSEMIKFDEVRITNNKSNESKDNFIFTETMHLYRPVITFKNIDPTQSPIYHSDPLFNCIPVTIYQHTSIGKWKAKNNKFATKKHGEYVLKKLWSWLWAKSPKLEGSDAENNERHIYVFPAITFRTSLSNWNLSLASSLSIDRHVCWRKLFWWMTSRIEIIWSSPWMRILRNFLHTDRPNFILYAVPKRELNRRGVHISMPIQTPTIALCLFAIGKQFFYEIGSYDKGMQVGGGENLEISFRVWLGGGSLEIHRGSRVGHSTHSQDKVIHHNAAPKTEVWMDGFQAFFHKMVPAAQYLSEAPLLADFKSLGAIVNRFTEKCIDANGKKDGWSPGLQEFHGSDGKQ
ncbi:hypothetical protein CRE_01181 [Caenorhabditis remanei]|uniref:T-box domain-containing protein n=1 Tax=Caenorhabditis remanei TaxID=31234 RepID=E3MWF6_CAERE|nr:hypothetical protein CRE_01181 [Caenorhabditis remanei]